MLKREGCENPPLCCYYTAVHILKTSWVMKSYCLLVSVRSDRSHQKRLKSQRLGLLS